MEDGVARPANRREFRVVFADGRIRWIHSRGRTVCDELGQPMRLVGVKVDITERKAAEQRLQEQQRNLAHSARVSVAGELSSALSHELNQPLAAILANAAAARRFLLHDPPDMQEISEILEAIAEDNRRAAAVVARFGSLLRRDLASMQPVDINDVVAGALGPGPRRRHRPRRLPDEALRPPSADRLRRCRAAAGSAVESRRRTPATRWSRCRQARGAWR